MQIELRNTRWRLTTLVLVFTLVGLWMCSSCPASITISVVPATLNIPVAGTASVDIVASGLSAGTAPSLGEFDLSLDYDELFLSATVLTFGAFLDVGVLGSIQFADLSVAGKVDFSEVSLETPAVLDAMQPDTFILATIGFEGLASGVTPLVLTINSLSDSSGDPLTADVIDGSTAAVPEPTTFLVWGGIAIAAWLRRCVRTGRLIAHHLPVMCDGHRVDPRPAHRLAFPFRNHCRQSVTFSNIFRTVKSLSPADGRFAKCVIRLGGSIKSAAAC
jgi:hypothetical protein